MFIICKAVIYIFVTEELAEESKRNSNEPQCFPIPGWANNSKHNKNIININGIFIIGLTLYFLLGLAISSRFGAITVSQGQIYFFVYFCCIPILLPSIYFMRNPKHLISVLQDHNIMSSPGTPQLVNSGLQMYKIVTDFAHQHFCPLISAPMPVRARQCVCILLVWCLVWVSIEAFTCTTFDTSFIFTKCEEQGNLTGWIQRTWSNKLIKYHIFCIVASNFNFSPNKLNFCRGN